MSDHGIGGFPDVRCPGVNHLRTISRLYYFFGFAALGALWMLTPVFTRYLGLSARDTGLIMGCRPFINAVFGALWTRLADKKQTWKKPILLLSVTAHILLSVSLALFKPTFSRETACLYKPLATVNWTAESAPSSVNHSVIMCNGTNNAAISPIGTEFAGARLSLRETFGVILALIAGNEALGSTIGSLADVAAYEHLGNGQHLQFGRLRVFGAIGWALSTLILSYMAEHSVDHKSTDTRVHLRGDYTLVFGVCAVLMGVAFIYAAMFKFSHHEDKHARAGLRQAIRQILEHETLAILLTSLYTGYVLGAYFTFFLWYLQDLGGTQLVMGISAFIALSSDVVAFTVAPYVIGRIGSVRTIYLALASQVLFTFYATSMSSPWPVLPSLVLFGVFHGLNWSAVQAFVIPRSAPGTESLMLGIMHSVQYGVGLGTGAFLSGVIISAVDSRWMFRITGFGSACVLLGYIAGQRCVNRTKEWHYSRLPSSEKVRSSKTNIESDVEMDELHEPFGREEEIPHDKIKDRVDSLRKSAWQDN